MTASIMLQLLRLAEMCRRICFLLTLNPPCKIVASTLGKCSGERATMLTDGLESRKQNQFAASHAALHQKTGAFGLHLRRRGAALQPANAQVARSAFTAMRRTAQLFTNCIFEARWKKGSRLHLTVMMTSMLPRVALLYLHFSVSMPPLLRITTAAAHNSRADFMRGVDDLLGVGLLAAREMRFAMRCAHKQRLQQRTLLIPGIFTSSSTARAEGAT